MPKLRTFTVDAFTRRLFGGNSAAICPLEGAWLPDQTLQSIAAENNLAETAFILPLAGAGWRIRWFTPAMEIDLCGHATLAAAHVLVNHLGFSGERMRFESRSGPLFVTRAGDQLVLDFPARPPEPRAIPDALLAGLGVKPIEVLRSRDFFAVLGSEDELRSLTPDYRTLATLDSLGTIVTARGRDVDFVSRFFAPQAGIDEDPVTGSAHCTLIPYWAARLGKTKMHALQLSPRGGELFCEHAGDRVKIGGHAVTYLVGEIEV